MLCSGGLERILYALSVTCRSVLIIERGKVRAECKVSVCVCECVQEKKCRERESTCSDAFTPSEAQRVMI